MHISAPKKFILTLIVLCVVIAVLLFILIIASRSVRNYRDALGVTVTKISEDEKDFDRLNNISSILKNQQQYIQRLQDIAVNRQRPLKFIETIEQMGHLTHTKISLTVSEIKGSTDALLFNATFEGNRNDTRRMLALILTLPYHITIESMSFQHTTPNALNTSQSTTRMTLTMRVKTQQ